MVPYTDVSREAAFARASATVAEQSAEVDRLGAKLRTYPRTGPMGMVADAIKFSPEYRADKAAYDKAFAILRTLNVSYVRTFRREIQAARRAKYAGAR